MMPAITRRAAQATVATMTQRGVLAHRRGPGRLRDPHIPRRQQRQSIRPESRAIRLAGGEPAGPGPPAWAVGRFGRAGIRSGPFGLARLRSRGLTRDSAGLRGYRFPIHADIVAPARATAPAPGHEFRPIMKL